MNRLMLRFAVVSLLLVTAAAPAFAGLGFHAGASIDPDQFLVGLRFKTQPVAESIVIVPNVDVGFGDDLTTISGNLDGHYQFKTDSKWAPYAGMGLSIYWFDYDGGSDTEFGGSILGGVMLNEKWFFETKVGLGDVPDLKFIVGFEKP